MDSNILWWFEIPVDDMSRAVKFYETVFAIQLSRNTLGQLEMALFPTASGKPGKAGALVRLPQWYKPSENGTLVYLSSQSNDISDELSRVESAGGKIIIPKGPISPELGFRALIRDSEGNRIALHSMK